MKRQIISMGLVVFAVAFAGCKSDPVELPNFWRVRFENVTQSLSIKVNFALEDFVVSAGSSTDLLKPEGRYAWKLFCKRQNENNYTYWSGGTVSVYSSKTLRVWDDGSLCQHEWE